MQRKLLVSTFAVAMGVTGIASAGGAGGGGHHTVKVETTQANPESPANVNRELTQQMQRALTARNLYQGKADGVWGPKTESALRNFQTQSGLDATGELNEATARALGIDATQVAAASQPVAPGQVAVTRTERQPVSGTDHATSPPPTTASSASVGTAPATTGTATPHSQAQLEDGATNIQLTSLSQEQAREMQQRLQLLGYYRGPVDGKVGEGTRSALRNYFHRQAELAQQGVINNSAISLFGTNVDDVQPVNGRDDARPNR
jgi:peptidoglycan hydrolase-like protein with peptidoglycan-binding domain